eukprot:5340783-Ditylum_brightwellii.AAC.1
MTEPLVNFIEYSGIAEETDKLMAGNGTQIQGIDDYTQVYLDQLRYIEGHTPEPSTPSTFTKYLGEVKRLHERTSSDQSKLIPVMASNFTWCTGYSPTRFRKGADLLIHKGANNNWVSKLHLS